jgi:predicted CoA-binding protein
VTPVEILRGARTIAVVGASDDPSKPSHRIPVALRSRGWTILPVNPNRLTVLGVESYKSVSDLPDGVDLVEVFRPSEEAEGIVREVVARGIGAVWLQKGIASPAAEAVAESAGVSYVEDMCMGVVAQANDLSAPA